MSLSESTLFYYKYRQFEGNWAPAEANVSQIWEKSSPRWRKKGLETAGISLVTSSSSSGGLVVSQETFRIVIKILEPQEVDLQRTAFTPSPVWLQRSEKIMTHGYL